MAAVHNPHRVTAEVGDLVVVITAHRKYSQKTGMRVWLEHDVAEVVGTGENGRIKAVLFAIDRRVARRRHLPGLVALITFKAKEICVPLAMGAAKDHGKPFASLEDVRAAVRPFVLIDLAARGYVPELAEVRDAESEAV